MRRGLELEGDAMEGRLKTWVMVFEERKLRLNWQRRDNSEARQGRQYSLHQARAQNGSDDAEKR